MPQSLPDLKDHTSFVTDVLKVDPTLYGKLKDIKTTSGVTLG
jgi:creatine kinase